MYNGNQTIDGVYIGDQQVDAIYIGDEQVYSNGGGGPTYIWDYDIIGTGGTFQVVNGIASGIAYNSYPKLKNKLYYDPNTMEVVIYFNSGTLTTYEYAILGSTDSSEYYRFRIGIGSKSSRYISFNLNTGTSSSTVVGRTGSNKVMDNTNYRASLYFDKSLGSFTCELYDEDAQTTVFSDSANCALAYNYLNICIGEARYTGDYNPISIDLNRSYIKINGSLIPDITTA